MVTSVKNNNIKEEYEKLNSKYDKLGASISHAIEIMLDEHSIQYLKVYYRVKETASFMGKIDRYNFKNPLEEIVDMCGIRIICYYKSDIDKICEIISNEFEVLKSQDKETLLKPDQFGYRSHHLIVQIKENWLNIPNYRGLDNLRAEIQIRTNLMHTWAEIEHKLGYKKEEDIPFEFRRKFSRLSAKLEEVDEQFEELKEKITIYRKESKDSYLKDENEMNLDTLQAYLDDYFPDRESAQNNTSILLRNLFNLNIISISQLKTLYEKCNHLLDDLEKDFAKLRGINVKLSQVNVVRLLLLLTVDESIDIENIQDDFYQLILEHRKKLI